jgi:hypothetical protein
MAQIARRQGWTRAGAPAVDAVTTGALSPEEARARRNIFRRHEWIDRSRASVLPKQRRT